MEYMIFNWITMRFIFYRGKYTLYLWYSPNLTQNHHINAQREIIRWTGPVFHIFRDSGNSCVLKGYGVLHEDQMYGVLQQEYDKSGQVNSEYQIVE